MSKIKIFTDSPADISYDVVQELNIGFFPVRILFGEEVVRDYIDITPAEFYKRIKTCDELPTTSQMTVLDFYEGFKSAVEEGYDTIICFTISKEASGTYQNAHLAGQMLEEDGIKADINIVAGYLSYVYGRAVVEAAKMAIDGYGKDEIIETATKMIDSASVYFLVDSLKYLKKGGRINATAATVGDILNIKPILSIDGGLVTVADKVRGSKKALSRMLDLIDEAGIRDAKEVYIFDGAAGDELIEKVKSELKDRFGVTNAEIAIVGPVIGTHAGPGLVGILIFK